MQPHPCDWQSTLRSYSVSPSHHMQLPPAGEGNPKSESSSERIKMVSNLDDADVQTGTSCSKQSSVLPTSEMQTEVLSCSLPPSFTRCGRFVARQLMMFTTLRSSAYVDIGLFLVIRTMYLPSSTTLRSRSTRHTLLSPASLL